MGYIIEITESKVSHLADTLSKVLHYGGEAMECIEEMRQGRRYEHMGERGYGRGGRYGMRDEEEYERERMDGYDRMGERERYGMDGYGRDRWDEPYMGERRGRSATTGRYVSR